VSGGTLFLDEIGDMPLALQAKVLRLLQEQVFERVGGNETVRTDVRLIAATHRDLVAWAAQGMYRPDLFYRLGVFTIHLPPLRERRDDLSLLVQHYVRLFSPELGRQVRGISPEAMERLRNYPWPGNIRELQSVLKRALLRSTGPVLVPAFLPELAPRQADEPAAEIGAGSPLEALIARRLRDGSQELYEEARQELDRFLLPLVLRTTGGNQLQAARVLGITRRTLRVRLRVLGLAVRMSVEGEEDDTIVPG
jgi:two-component system nitrogen regulation response regulator GlnG